MKAMKKILAIIVIAGLLFISKSVSAPAPPRVTVNTATMNTSPFVLGVNSIRESKHLNPLTEVKVLDKVANLKASDMCARDYWSHNDPNGRSWLYFFNKADYRYTVVGENLAMGFDSTDTTIVGWVNSPEHYINIIDPRFTETGVASISCPSYQNNSNITITVNEFGAP